MSDTSPTTPATQPAAALLGLVRQVEDLDRRATDEARAAYRAMLFRLAREEPGPDDTPATVHAISKEAGRGVGELEADLRAVVELVGLAADARRLAELRDADRQAAGVLRAGQEEHARVVAAADARLRELERARDETSGQLYGAADAQRALLQRLGLDEAYEAAVDGLAAVEQALADGAALDADAVLELGAEVERRRAEVWAVWERAMGLGDHDPFRAPLAPAEDQPTRVEGCKWEVSAP